VPRKPSQNRRITPEEQAELVEAIEQEEIANASAFAQEFADKHGLNPTTVRSRISRLRRQLGKATRPPTMDEFFQTLAAPRLVPKRRSAGGATAGSAFERDVELAAAALLRYEKDEAFREAVDRRRREVERLYETLTELRTAATALSEGERAEIIRMLLPLVSRSDESSA
jgi:hypothetical protein